MGFLAYIYIFVIGWPSMGLRFGPETNTSHILQLLTAASAKAPEKFSVFTHDTMPPAYHYSHHSRIAPIYVVPNIGYALTNQKEGDSRFSKGVCHADMNCLRMFTRDGNYRTMATIIPHRLCTLCSFRMDLSLGRRN